MRFSTFLISAYLCAPNARFIGTCQSFLTFCMSARDSNWAPQIFTGSTLTHWAIYSTPNKYLFLATVWANCVGLMVQSCPAGHCWAWASSVDSWEWSVVTRSSGHSHIHLALGSSSGSKQDIDTAHSIKHAWTSSHGNRRRNPKRKARQDESSFQVFVGSTLVTVSSPKQVVSHKASQCGKRQKFHVKEGQIQGREEFVAVPEIQVQP